MKNFYNISPILFFILVLLGFSIALIITNKNFNENYIHFNTFFCSGWAGNCLIK